MFFNIFPYSFPWRGAMRCRRWFFASVVPLRSLHLRVSSQIITLNVNTDSKIAVWKPHFILLLCGHDSNLSYTLSLDCFAISIRNIQQERYAYECYVVHSRNTTISVNVGNTVMHYFIFEPQDLDFKKLTRLSCKNNDNWLTFQQHKTLYQSWENVGDVV
jgi:hypothetical protein